MKSLRNIVEYIMFELRLLSLTSHQQQIPMDCSSVYVACVMQNDQWRRRALVNAS